MRSAAVGAFVVAVLLVVVAGVLAAKLETIPPGFVGVSVAKCGGTGTGVRPTPIPSGYYWRELFCEQVIEYPTSLQTLILTRSPHEGSPHDDSVTVNSSEGMPINVDCSLSFTLDGAKVPSLYTKFRNTLDQIKETYLRQTVREALQATYAKYTAEQLYADKREASRAEAQSFLADKLLNDGFVITQFTINETRVPEQVKNAINAKVAMIQDAQKAEQEVRKTQALAAQRVAEAEGQAKAKRALADAEAYYNTTVAKSLTPQLVQMEQVKKWDGTLPQTSCGNATPFINIK
jgi:regulator of protease activity HflC (stomatin/prohibitin superfamily)